MKYLICCALLLFSNLLYSQSLRLTPLQGNRNPIHLKKGDLISMMTIDTVFLDNTSNYKIKKLSHIGFIEELNEESILLRNRKGFRRGNFSIEIDDIKKIKKHYRVLQPLTMLPIAAGTLFYLNSIGQPLYFWGPPSVFLLGASIVNNLVWNQLISPTKRTSPEYYKKRNRWDIEVVMN